MRWSACIEWLFAAEEPDFARRIHLAAAAGLDAVEFWTWQDKNLDAIETALRDTGVSLTAICAEPMIDLTDAGNRPRFLAGLAASADVAHRLGAKILIAQTGDDLPLRPRADQRAALAETLRQAADVLAGSGIVLGIEPLNTPIDHPGYFLSSTSEGLDILDDVGRPGIGMVYDIYHAAVMGERTDAVLAGRLHHVVHVHLADHPGRGAPFTGTIDLAGRLAWLVAEGYRGRVGLEYKPGADTGATLAALAALG